MMSAADEPVGTQHLEPTEESLHAVVDFLDDRAFVMLNLFRLREVADYSNHPDLEPETPSTCRELFLRYIAHMDGYLADVGATRMLLADGGPCLVGPSDERWDVVQMVRYPSRQAFLDLGLAVRDEVPLREVMVADSRVVPMYEQPLDAPTRTR